MAAHYGNFNIIHELLASSANINALNKGHLTPLQIACKNNNTVVFNILLENGG